MNDGFDSIENRSINEILVSSGCHLAPRTAGLSHIKTSDCSGSYPSPLVGKSGRSISVGERPSIRFKIKQLLDWLTLADDRERSGIQHDLRRKRPRVVV